MIRGCIRRTSGLGALPRPMGSIAGFPAAPNGMPNVFHASTESREAQYQDLLSRAARRTLDHLNVLHKDPISGELSCYDYFAKMDRQLRKENPGAKLYVSGGVVRCLLGYIYARLYAEHKVNSGDPEKITEDVLKAMIEEKDRRALWDVLGIGSDLDLLVDGISRETATACLGSFALPGERDQRLSHLHYDINEYSAQMERATKQGGSSLDFLAVSLGPDQGFRTPDSLPLIIPHFLRGRVSVLPMDGAENPQITTARLIRTFAEVPFLQPLPEDQLLTETAVQKLADQFPALDWNTRFKIEEQFRKAVKNCRFPKVCNFISVPHPNNTPLELAWRRMPRELLKEFLDHTPIDERSDAFDPGGLRAKGLLMPFESFIAEQTDGGVLYHGTPYLENLFYMVRSGLYVSSKVQGGDACGRGFYTTPNPSVAMEYSRGVGFLMPLPLNQSPHIRILSLNRCPSEIIAEAKDKGEDLHQYLATVYGIDIIINQHILIQNMDALILPRDIPQWLDTIQKPLMERISQLSESQGLSSDFERDWKKGNTTDNIFWMLYQKTPLLTQLLKTVLPWFKDLDRMKETLKSLQRLNIVSTPQFHEELLNQIHAIILHGSKEEQENLIGWHHILWDAKISRISVSKELSSSVIMSWLPHITEDNYNGIIRMIILVENDAQLLEDIATYFIPLLSETNLLEFDLSRTFVTDLSKDYSVWRSRSGFPNKRIISIISEKVKNAFAREDIKEIRDFVDKEAPNKTFYYWTPSSLYKDLLETAFKTFVQRQEKEAQMLCMDIVTCLARESSGRGKCRADEKDGRSGRITAAKVFLKDFKIQTDFIGLLKQTPDLVTYEGVQEFCNTYGLDKAANDLLVSVLLSILINPASSPETKRGAKVCLGSIVDLKEGVKISL